MRSSRSRALGSAHERRDPQRQAQRQLRRKTGAYRSRSAPGRAGVRTRRWRCCPGIDAGLQPGRRRHGAGPSGERTRPGHRHLCARHRAAARANPAIAEPVANRIACAGPGVPTRSQCRRAIRGACRPGRDVPEHGAAQSLLPDPQNGAAGTRAGWQDGLDHRPAPRTIRRPRRRALCGPQRRGPRQDQPPVRLDLGRCLALHRDPARGLQPAARRLLPQHRLRALHARDCAGRRLPRRPLVVGEQRAQRVRFARGQTTAEHKLCTRCSGAG